VLCRSSNARPAALQLPVTLQSIHGEQDDVNDRANIRAEMTTAGRNKEAIERAVMRLSIEDAVASLKAFSDVGSAME